MKVVLLENLKKIGSIGEIIDVKRGFARNFLIANKKALYASKENIIQVEKIKTQLSKVNETPEDEITFLSLTNGDIDNFLFESQLNEVTCDVEKIETEVVTFNEHQLETGDKISLVVEPGLSVGIGTSSNIRISRDSLTGSILVNPIVFTSEGVSTSTNSINLSITVD